MNSAVSVSEKTLCRHYRLVSAAANTLCHVYLRWDFFVLSRWQVEEEKYTHTSQWRHVTFWDEVLRSGWGSNDIYWNSAFQAGVWLFAVITLNVGWKELSLCLLMLWAVITPWSVPAHTGAFRLIQTTFWWIPLCCPEFTFLTKHRINAHLIRHVCAHVVLF